MPKIRTEVMPKSMRFSLYIQRHGMLHKVFAFRRTARGLYVVFSREPGNYTSYHEDGRYWTQVSGQKRVKMLREPLSEFRGSETVKIGYAAFDEGPSPLAIAPATVKLRPEDIVVDHAGPGIVGVEVILSDQRLELARLPERHNSQTFTIATRPLLILEAFTLAGLNLSGPRFHRPPQAIHAGEGMPARI